MPILFQDCNRFANLCRLTFLLQHFRNRACFRRGQIDGRFITLERGNGLIFVDLLACSLEPIPDLDLADRFTQFRHFDFN